MTYAPAARTRAASRSLGVRIVSGLFILGVGSVVGFLSGAGTGAVYDRLVPMRAQIVSLVPRAPESTFKLVTHHGVLAAIIDPHRIRIDLDRGWNVEQTAFKDNSALLYFTGPFFEEQPGYGYDARTIGDTYFYGQLTLADHDSRGFAERRYYMALTKGGRIEFGYGGWQPGYADRYNVFVGGMGYLYAPDPPPPDYSNPYSGLTQRIHDAIPRERLVVGKDGQGHLVVIKTPPTMTAGAIKVAKSLGLVEAYFLDQGNKARFIAPGQVNDRPRFNLPYLLRVADRDQQWQPVTQVIDQPRWPEKRYHWRVDRLRRLRRRRHHHVAIDSDVQQAPPAANPMPAQGQTQDQGQGQGSDPFAN